MFNLDNASATKAPIKFYLNGFRLLFVNTPLQMHLLIGETKPKIKNYSTSGSFCTFCIVIKRECFIVGSLNKEYKLIMLIFLCLV